MPVANGYISSGMLFQLVDARLTSTYGGGVLRLLRLACAKRILMYLGIMAAECDTSFTQQMHLASQMSDLNTDP
jgi:hypothetical protein